MKAPPVYLHALGMINALVAVPGCHHKKGGYLRPVPVSSR